MYDEVPETLPEWCRFKNTWHAGEPEQRSYPGKSRNHVVESGRSEMGYWWTSCSRCGAHARSGY